MKFNTNAEKYLVNFYNHEQILVDMGIQEATSPIIMECQIMDCEGRRIVKIDRGKHYWEGGTWSWNGRIYNKFNSIKEIAENYIIISLGGRYTVGQQIDTNK